MKMITLMEFSKGLQQKEQSSITVKNYDWHNIKNSITLTT